MIRQIKPVGLKSIGTKENKNLVKEIEINDESTSTVQFNPTISDRETKTVHESRGLQYSP